jgi:peptidoglycan/xylan/chitin deacetylase (PgdA/CDA1 family)
MEVPATGERPVKSGPGPFLALVFLVPVLAACAEQDSQAMEIPDRTVVLTFDDALRSHLEYVAPALRKHGFRATFFVTNAWREDHDRYLSWEEIAELHRLGFEVGNHTWGHFGHHQRDMDPEERNADVELVEVVLGMAGVPRPRCFAWPGDAFGPETLRLLGERGYRFARRGSSPEVPRGTDGDGPLYDPRVHHPLLVPSTAVARSTWTLDRFRRIVSRAEPGKAVVLQFHGVPDPANPDLGVSPGLFARFLDLLDQEGYRVVALGDLADEVPPEARPADPLVGTRWQ